MKINLGKLGFQYQRILKLCHSLFLKFWLNPFKNQNFRVRILNTLFTNHQKCLNEFSQKNCKRKLFFWQKNSNNFGLKINVARSARSFVRWDILRDFQPLWVRWMKGKENIDINLSDFSTFVPRCFTFDKIWWPTCFLKALKVFEVRNLRFDDLPFWGSFLSLFL